MVLRWVLLARISSAQSEGGDGFYGTDIELELTHETEQDRKLAADGGGSYQAGSYQAGSYKDQWKNVDVNVKVSKSGAFETFVPVSTRAYYRFENTVPG